MHGSEHTLPVFGSSRSWPHTANPEIDGRQSLQVRHMATSAKPPANR